MPLNWNQARKHPAKNHAEEADTFDPIMVRTAEGMVWDPPLSEDTRTIREKIQDGDLGRG